MSRSPAPDLSRSPGLRAEIGVIGGSGFYEFLDDAETLHVPTPFGEPSGDLVVGQVAGRSVAFLARHGAGHRYPPHRVPYRANLWALRSLGVRQVVAPSAVGSLRPDLGPGCIVVPDQVVDRTWGRPHTVYDDPGVVVHVSFADPYCPRGRAVAASAAAGAGCVVEPAGTLVVINGPRFSSRAESRWHQAAGWTIVGMTGLPEAAIARELAMCYTCVALVTDLDAGVDGDGGVHQEDVFAVFSQHIGRLKAIVGDVVAGLPAAEPDGTATCSCRRALDGIRLPFELPT